MQARPPQRGTSSQATLAVSRTEARQVHAPLARVIKAHYAAFKVSHPTQQETTINRYLTNTQAGPLSCGTHALPNNTLSKNSRVSRGCGAL